jgi:hypothetical protein
MLKLIGAVAAAAFLWQSAGTAQATTVTYDLTLAGDFSGTGTLSFTNGPVDSSSGAFAATDPTLTLNVDGLTFDPTATNVVFQFGNLWNVTFGWTFDPTNTAEMDGNGTSAQIFFPTTGKELDATITAQLQTTNAVSNTPLPAALPLFATALAGLGLLGWYRKRTAIAA